MSTIIDHGVALMAWMQLHDSAFPAGRLVHSHGLEEWLAQRPDADPDEVSAAVIDYLVHSFAPLDATITAAACRAADAPDVLCDLDDLIGSYKLFDNARAASQSTGAQLATVASQSGMVLPCHYLDGVLAGNHAGHCAVVEGAVQGRLGIPVHTAVAGSIRSMLASMLSSAVRLGRLGPMRSQQVQVRLAATVVDLARDSCRRSPHDVWSTAPGLEISGMCHEIRTMRQFAS